MKKNYNSNFVTHFYCVFENLKKENLKCYLFENNITSYIRQDIILSIFKLGNNIDSYINMLNFEKDWFEIIDKNNLVLDESIEAFKQNYLLSNCIFSYIKTTLSEFIQIDDKTLKNTIDSILNKINLYYSGIDGKFSAITFLGYNAIIRNYFKNYKNQDIKVVLKNVITN